MSTSTIARGPSPEPERAEPGEASFPPGFLWGAATSAYQIEGAAIEDGRGASIWDTYCRVPGATRAGENGDVAADHYHRFADDVALMRELGLQGYRFSVAWPRIQPDGEGAVNERGLDFYRRLVDSLLEAGIAPVLTLSHWDLPQRLQDRGGWPERETAYRFADYARIVFEALGDRVPYWMTLNEPWCSAFLGYGIGRHAPGERDPHRAVRAGHHLLLAHGLATAVMRSIRSEGCSFGIPLNLAPIAPATGDPADVEAARRVDGMHNRFFLGPILQGAYPVDVLADLAERTDLSYVLDGDQEIMGAPLDLLGVNYYRGLTVRALRHEERQEPVTPTLWPGAEEIGFVVRERPLTAMGWEVDPEGLTDLLVGIHERYRPIPLVVTENGAAYEDVVDAEGRIHDEQRVGFLDRHVRAAQRAIQRGVDLRGYFVWSFLDNFEWAEGYARRFGLVYVDYPTQRRIVKDSGSWYRGVIARNGPPTEDESA